MGLLFADAPYPASIYPGGFGMLVEGEAGAAMSVRKVQTPPSTPSASWTFLTNYAHVLICLSRDPEALLRDVATMVGITERAVQRIVADLEEAGYLKRQKEGRRNTYKLSLNKALRHPVEKNCTIGDLIATIE